MAVNGNVAAMPLKYGEKTTYSHQPTTSGYFTRQS